ncbi:MAG: restriction endonuclease [Desulfobacteraceae bacterium]|jgi:hypothetical protein
MKLKMRPYERTVASSSWWFFLIAALVIYSGLTFFSYHLSAMEHPPVWCLWVTRFSELIGIVILFPIVLSFRRSQKLNGLLSRQSPIKTLKALPEAVFLQKLADTIQRMGYTTLLPDVTGSATDPSFKIINNSQVTLVHFKREALIRSSTVKGFTEKMFTEGAERGILVTTGLFSNSVLRRRMDDPVFFLDGITLLSLLSKHRSTCMEKNSFSDTFDRFPNRIKDDPFLKETSPVCPACGADMGITLSKTEITYWECVQKPECDMTLEYELCPL